MAKTSRKRIGQVRARLHSAAGRKVSVAENLLVLATNPDYVALCSETVKKLPPRLRVTVSSRSAMSTTHSTPRSTLVVSRLTDLSRSVVQHSDSAATTKQVVFVNELPIEAVVQRLMSLQIRSSQRLHIASKCDKVSEAELLYRLVSGMAEHEGDTSIVDAWVEEEELVLLSPSFDRIVIPREKLDRFLGRDMSKLSKFEIDEDGRFLYWPHSDTHLGWQQLQQLIDPLAAIADVKKTEQFKERYGNAIRTLRESAGLNQADVTGIAPRQLRRIEHGEQMVSRNSLEALAAAHNMPIDEYMCKLANLTTNF